MTNMQALIVHLKLTEDEADLLHRIWALQSNKEIAVALGIRLGTTKSKVFRLYKKLNVPTRVGAALVAERAIVLAHAKEALRA